LWNEELLKHVQIHDTGNGRLHEEKGAVRYFSADGPKLAVFYYIMTVQNVLYVLYKFLYSFKVVQLFFKHPVLLALHYRLYLLESLIVAQLIKKLYAVM
jgi:hypothetical protein